MKLKLLVAGIFWSLVVYSQKVQILNQKTHLPINNVLVYNLSKSQKIVSDSNGVVLLNAFNEIDTLVFRHPAYELLTIPKVMIGNTLHLKELHVKLNTFVLSASRDTELVNEVSSTIDVIESKRIMQLNPQTAADVLQLNGSVFVQKSQMGGGSPIIRGFEANRVLLVVDGVRMNNAIFRSGHLQNAITIDQNVLERTEILFGPSSVMYGSDALGGVVHYYTLLPEYSKEGFKVNSNAFVRYSSANNEKTGHLNFSFRNKKWTSFTGLSYSDFGDLRMGGTTNPSYPRFGIEKYYADRIDGKDTMVLKDDLLLQKGTAYSQWGAIQKFRFKINDSVEVVLNTQYSTSSDIPRYDQLTDYKGDKLKFAEWYYGPQNRLFSALAVEVNKPAWLYSRFKVIGAYQKIDEDRYERKFNNPNRSVNQEDVQVVSANIDLFKDYGTTKTLSYGGEAYFNDVVSTAYKENIENGTTSPEQTRYPDGGSKYNSFAVYTSFKNHFHPKATYHIGARYNMVTLLAGFEDTTFVKLPFNKIEFSNASLTASAGLAYQPNERWNIGLNASSGFRSPNVDDVGKVFSKNDYVMVPNNEVKPEYAYSGEFNLTHSLLDEKVKISGTVFYTFVKDMIVRKPYTLNGADSLVYDGEKLKIQTNLNSDKAEISGFSISLDVTLTKEFKVLSSLSKTYANSLTDTLPVAHIPPLYGRTDFLLQIDELFLDVYLVYNAQKPISEFSLTGEDNADKATADGSPAWYTINIASTINLSKKIALQLGMENLLDVHYRTFSSGVSAPGRNFIAALRASF